MREDTGHTDGMASCCRHIVQDLIEEYGWALLQEDDLVRLVLGSIQSEASPAEVKRLAKHHYTIALYETCRQDKDPVRRERGYYELSRFLFRVAYNRWYDLAEDAAQRALVLVYEQIDRCRSPGTFLAFAINKLRQAFKDEQRARGKEPASDEIGQSSTGKDQAAFPLCVDQRELLLNAIERLPKDFEQKAILLKYYGGLSDAEIGEHLGISAGYVRVLRCRGIARLREDEQLRGYVMQKT